jgi:excinuclease ABC subunit A
VDGQLRALEDDIPLDRRRNHSIEIVVDRLIVRPGIERRLTESVDIALALAGDIVLINSLDAGDRLFSRKLACVNCGLSIPELSPRAFSFNSPHGGCPDCQGLGALWDFDPARIVPDPSRSLLDGAIAPWAAGDRRLVLEAVTALGRNFDIDASVPFLRLPKKSRDLLLFGPSAISRSNGNGGARGIGHGGVDRDGAKAPSRAASTARQKDPYGKGFEGIIPNLRRRYEQATWVDQADIEPYRSLRPCGGCHGERLRPESRAVQVKGRTISELVGLPMSEALRAFETTTLSSREEMIAGRIHKEIIERLRFLVDVGVGYLTLGRSAATLSGGEAQRIRLASQIGSGLTGVMYVLDEPSIGLHQRDNDRLIGTLKYLRDLGNSVLVVEHDEDMIRAADHVVDLGPGAGVHGGRVIAQGSVEDVIAAPGSLTGQYLGRVLRIPVPARRTAWRQADELEAPGAEPVAGMPPRKSKTEPTPGQRAWARRGAITSLRITGARGNNLQGVDVEIPVGLLTCVTGVSGSGKSTLVNDTLYAAVARRLYQSHVDAAPFDEIEGIEHFDKVINVDQSPIGRTPRSNPATYTGLFTPIRELFAEVPAARERGYGAGRFSFNVAGGRCEACQGDGVLKVEMHFLPDVYVPCDVCAGARYNRETLEILYRGKNITEVLMLTVEDAHAYFSAVPSIARKLQTLLDVGLGYITLGQSATTLSGGEAQRVKLALELSKRDTGRTLYILDEPTTGLHFADIALLLRVLHQLRDAGNTIVVIEHNLDVIKTADWLIDMGPEGGAGGGQVVVVGTPEDVAADPASHTGRYLKAVL